MIKIHFGQGNVVEGNLVASRPYETDVEFEFVGGAKLNVPEVKKEVLFKMSKAKRALFDSEIFLNTGVINLRVPEKRLPSKTDTAKGVVIDGKTFTQDIQGPPDLVKKMKEKMAQPTNPTDPSQNTAL